MLLCMLNYMCRGVCGLSQSLQWCSSVKVRVSPVASQCGADSTKFLQWHSSVGLFQISFSNGVPVYPAGIHWVAQWYPSVHWVNQWHSSGIPVYTGPASVHWLRVREVTNRAMVPSQAAPIVNVIIENTFESNCNQNYSLLMKKVHFWNIVHNMSPFLSRPQYV